jgi:hypothetical protein
LAINPVSSSERTAGKPGTLRVGRSPTPQQLLLDFYLVQVPNTADRILSAVGKPLMGYALCDTEAFALGKRSEFTPRALN